MAGTAEHDGLLGPLPEVVDAVEAAVVVLSDVAPLVSGCCKTEEASLLALAAGRKSGEGCVKLAALTSYAADLGKIPVSVATATDGWEVPLDEPFLTLVPHQSVDFVSLALLSKSARVLHEGGLAAGH